MNRNSVEWKLENEWLQEVLKEARKQFNEKKDLKRMPLKHKGNCGRI